MDPESFCLFEFYFITIYFVFSQWNESIANHLH